MDLLSVIRRWYHREDRSIREIARRTGLSRNTIRKYLHNGEIEPKYSKRQSPSKLDVYESTLVDWLKQRSNSRRKQRRTVKQLYRDLQALGYDGSYDRVAAYARDWRQSQRQINGSPSKQTYIPLQFAPGEAFQFDWSEEYVVIAGRTTKVQMAHFKLSYSRAFYLRAYWTQTHEMLFDAHSHAFSAFGGVPQRGIYDNMKTAVDRVGRGKQRAVNTRFAAMTSHYLYEAEFCNPAAGWEKGQIEKQVRDSRHRLWQQAPAFSTLNQLNDWLNQRCRILWQQLSHPQQSQHTLEQLWRQERAHLMPKPPAFDGYIEYPKRVSSTCLITFERNRYSVPATYANRSVSLRVYAAQLVIVAEDEFLYQHERVFSRDHIGPGKTLYDWRHYLSVLQRKPGALRNGEPFQQLPSCFQQLQKKLLKQIGGDRAMVDILALVLHHDQALVEQAVQQALDSGGYCKEQVINALNRLLDTPAAAPIEAPQALCLQQEPLANVQRYDQLRENIHAC